MKRAIASRKKLFAALKKFMTCVKPKRVFPISRETNASNRIRQPVPNDSHANQFKVFMSD